MSKTKLGSQSLSHACACGTAMRKTMILKKLPITWRWRGPCLKGRFNRKAEKSRKIGDKSTEKAVLGDWDRLTSSPLAG